MRTLAVSGSQLTQLFSMAYSWSSPNLLGDSDSDYEASDQEIANVQCENDYVIDQASQYEGQLLPFCSVNPLKSYALDEISRCAGLGVAGLKLHFSSSEVDMTDPDSAALVLEVLTLAREEGLPVAVHFGDLEALCYDADGTCIEPNETAMEDAMTVMLEETLPAVPAGLHLTFAHVTGVGAFPDWTSSTFSMLIDAYVNGGIPEIQGHELYVDVAAVFPDSDFTQDICPEDSDNPVCTVPPVADYSALGSVLAGWPIERLFWGSDFQLDGFTNTVENWPLSDDDFNTMAAATGSDFRDTE